MIHRCALAGLAFLALFANAHAVVPSGDQRAVRSIADVIQNAKRRDKVVIQGKIKKPFDFDTFLVEDGTGEIAVSFLGVKQHLGAGDEITVYGRYDGRRSYRTDFALLNTIEWSLASLSPAADLKQKYGVEPIAPAPTVTTQENPSVIPSVENRLRQLDDLKNKGFVTPDEYNEQRKRILNDL